MRGSHNRKLSAIDLGGIIPAHAGLTEGHPILCECLRDHPRACGAHLQRKASRVFTTGSSPRMRGSQPHLRAVFLDSGIIPAHAGLT